MKFFSNHRGRTREERLSANPSKPSTQEEKDKRHKAKLRIWSRCVRKLSKRDETESPQPQTI